jgi:hypothetical protein
MIRRAIWQDIECRGDGDELMREVKHFMARKNTGQIVLNITEGIVGSIVFRERVPENGQGVPSDNGHSKVLLDKGMPESCTVPIG